MLKIHNKQLFFAAIILSIFGILMIYSASSYGASLHMGDAFFFVKKQVVAFIIAICGYFIAKNINIVSLKNGATAIYVISVILLLLVFVPKIGVENYGAKRWLNLGVTTFQPSEIAKFALVIIIARILSNNSSNAFKTLASVLGLSLLIVSLILLQPNMSIAITILLVVLSMLFVGGTRIYQFMLIGFPMLVIGIILILLEPYRLARLSAFLDPFKSPLNEGYQLIQSYYALAGGGVIGVGLFNSRQKYLFLPFAESDFIISIIGEELGLVGCIFTIAIILIIVFEIIIVAKKSKDRFSAYLAFGIGAIIAIQSMLNVAVVSGTVPPTGLPMPFVSFGGSSLVVFYFFLGVVENISKESLVKYPLNRIY